jgi:hypothetical protein
MNRKLFTAILTVSLTLLVVSATISVIRAAPALVLTPTSGTPEDSINVEGTGFAASKTVGIGWGPPVEVVKDPATVTKEGSLEFYGTTSQHPIEPNSFKWTYQYGAMEMSFPDNGDGTLYDPAGGRLSSGSINYTSGYFHCIMQTTSQTITPGKFSYTTYYFNSINSTFPILPTDGSGAITGQITVPQIWNGTETVTVIDEAGNVGTSDFTVEGSDVIPEPLTLGAIMLLSSAALFVGFCWLRKKTINKIVKCN